MKIKYRAVRDNWLGYEVQCKRWWWPWWYQCYGSNTEPNIMGCDILVENHKKGFPRRGNPVVKKYS